MRLGTPRRAAMVLAIALAGCGLLEPTSRGSFQDLATARALWQSAALTDYDLRIVRSCFCMYEGVVRVAVRDGERVSTVFETTSDGLPAQPVATDHPTVEELFVLVAEALDQGAAEVRVTYHAVLGYPVELWIDRSVDVVDEEIGYTAEVVAPGAPGG